MCGLPEAALTIPPRWIRSTALRLRHCRGDIAHYASVSPALRQWRTQFFQTLSPMVEAILDKIRPSAYGSDISEERQLGKGPGDQLLMVVLAALEEGPAHGYLIARRALEWSDGQLRLREGSLYPILHGLERDGLVTVHTEAQGERVRRVYELTRAGVDRLAAERDEFLRQTHVMRRILWRGMLSDII